jgi:hypothetical protein
MKHNLNKTTHTSTILHPDDGILSQYETSPENGFTCLKLEKYERFYTISVIQTLFVLESERYSF